MFRKLLLVCIFILGISTCAEAANFVTANISAQNTFTGTLAPSAWGTRSGFLNISVSGSWSGTVTLQRRFGSSGTFYDVETWTANAEKALIDPERKVQYRLGIKTGDYSSGVATCRLGREEG